MANSLRDLQNRIAAEIEKEDGPEALAATIIASNHVYSCTCMHCLHWWARVGPDGGEPGDYGPFTKEQVNAEQVRLGIEVTS